MTDPLQDFDINIGSLTEPGDDTELVVLRNWLLCNLVTKKWNCQRDGIYIQKFKFLQGEYQSKPRSYNLTEEQVCNRFGVDSTVNYVGYNEQGANDNVSIIKSMEMLSLFKEASMPDPNDQEAVDASFDTKRFAIYEEDLIHHPKYDKIGPTIEALREKVIKFAQSKDPRITFSVFTVLFSAAGGERQDLHVDEIRRVSRKEAIHSAIVALEPTGAVLDMSSDINDDDDDRIHVPIKFGSCILFHGFQTHGGAAYSQANIRFHFYLHHDAAALEPFKRNARATLLDCEACEVVTSTPLNCGLKFRSPWHRANHYRLEHAEWWEYHLDLRKWWNYKQRLKRQVIFNRNWREKKKQQRMENEDEEES